MFKPEKHQKVSSNGSIRRWFWALVNPHSLSYLIWALAILAPETLLAVDWPWSKKPDVVTANCVLEQKQIEQGSPERLRAKVEASDTRGHALSYGWSANGGRILGEGSEVQVDVSGLTPGVYSLAARAQDAHGQAADCVAHFQIVPPQNTVTISCASEPPTVEPGIEVLLKAEATDRLGYQLRYHWFANGGKIQREGQHARLDTAGLLPGLYTVTGRVEDGWGGAADCVLSVTVKVEAPPPAPLEPVNLAQIVFLRNQSSFQLTGQEQLQRVLRRLLDEPGSRISIEAYAGPEETNPESLAAARAEGVKRYLVESGVEESRIQVLVGLGGRLGGLRNQTLDIIWFPEGLEY